MWRRCCYTIALIGLCVTASAVTQEGNVRTIARKGQAGQPVEGAVIRLQGSHNKVASRSNGDFSLLLYDLQNGEAYSIASVVKSGYEPAEQELIGKKIPCSDKVPLEIYLVNKMQLMQEREEIESKARENVERYYQARLDSLEQLLAAKRISETEMAAQKQRLESQYENFEPLLQAMSNVLARTDYQRMDSLTALMQQAIENGNPEEAERLLREKGSMEQREAVLREWGKNIDALQQEVNKNQAEYARQKRQLEDDCFRMYAACLTRFQNDSANYYIQKRAALDSLNVDYQLQAGQFVRDIMADNQLAMTYFERAYRIAEAQYGEFSGQMATTCLEIGLTYKAQHDLDQAEEWYQRALTIDEKQFGKNSEQVGYALNNLGELYRAKKAYKQALNCHSRALKIREKTFGKNSYETAVCKNNLAVVYVKQKQFEKAETLYKEVFAIYQNNPQTPHQLLANTYTNLGVMAFRAGRYEEALDDLEQAVTIYNRVFGPTHPRTEEARKLLTAIKERMPKP